MIPTNYFDNCTSCTDFNLIMAYQWNIIRFRYFSAPLPIWEIIMTLRTKVQ